MRKDGARVGRDGEGQRSGGRSGEGWGGHRAQMWWNEFRE
jgi:hypothetical protein